MNQALPEGNYNVCVQVKDYAAHIKPEDIPHTVGNWNGYQVPFLFASNGRAYLEQLRTKSGIWFLDVREQENQPYPIRNWFSPSDLMEKLGQNTVAANQALRRELSACLPLPIEYAPMSLCTDNGAMVGALGYYYAAHCPPADPYSLEVVPSLSMTTTAWNTTITA